MDREFDIVRDGYAVDRVPAKPERRDTALAMLVLVAYALAHFGMRVVVSGTAELDEAEQLVLSQTLALGYDDQPPLYTWIQALAFRVLGPGIPALALVKNALLFGTHLFVFLSARRVLGRAGPALVTSLALYLLPQIAWESRRDLTNSVLATTVAAATFKDRWLQPILFLAPLYVMARAADAGTPPGRRRVFALLAFLASLVTLAAPALQVWVGPRFGAHSRLNVPFKTLAGEIRQSGFDEGTVLAEEVFLAGNLRLAFPRARVLTPDLPAAGVMEGRPVLLVWRAHRSDEPPTAMAEWAARIARMPLDAAPPPSHAEAPFGGAEQRTYRIGFLMLTPLVRTSSLR